MTLEIKRPEELIKPDVLAKLKEFFALLSSDPEINQTILIAGAINLTYKIASREPTKEEVNCIVQLLFPPKT